jgi:hypothetical protein
MDFHDVVREKLSVGFAMVVIIGPRWAADQRLQDPNDLHREEIRTALSTGIHVVPVLVVERCDQRLTVVGVDPGGLRGRGRQQLRVRAAA